MTAVVDPHILAEMLDLMNELADDWEYEDEITPETQLLGELGLESLDLVVLGTTLQQRYGRLPFTELLADLGQRPPEDRDITVGELVQFVCENRGASTTGGAS